MPKSTFSVSFEVQRAWFCSSKLLSLQMHVSPETCIILSATNGLANTSIGWKQHENWGFWNPKLAGILFSFLCSCKKNALSWEHIPTIFKTVHKIVFLNFYLKQGLYFTSFRTGLTDNTFCVWSRAYPNPFIKHSIAQMLFRQNFILKRKSVHCDFDCAHCLVFP